MRRLLRGLLVCALPIAAACSGERGSPRPSILLITLDTARADRLSVMGYDRPTTPRLDALAATGVLFRHAVAQAALTPVSHASILTGLWPPHHGVRVLYAGSGFSLPEEVPTLATVLRREGYRTAAFLSAFPVSEFFGLQRGFDHFDNGIDGDPTGILGPAEDGAWRFDTAANQRRSDATTAAVLEWVDGSAGALDPLFMWVHYWDPHDPWLQPPAEELRGWVDADPAQRATWLRQVYDAEMHYMDAQIGRLFDGLAAAGLAEGTVVVVVSDHGEGLGEHNHWFHRILYEEQLHVPLILRIPGGPGGLAIDAQVRTVDILPTLLELAGATAVDADGESLLPLLAPGAPQLPRPAYAEALIAYDLNAVHLVRARPDDAVLHAWSDGRYKLIHKPLRPERGELYDLLEDPDEAVNLFGTQRDVVRRLLAEMETIGPYVDRDFGAGNDPEVIERLRSLGYVE